MKKTLIWDFFTTLSFRQFLYSFFSLTFKLPFLRYWKYSLKLENKFLSYIWKKDSKIISFYNWRSSIFHSLKMIWLKKDDEVIVCSYTCISVSNAVLQSLSKIIYSDIDENNLGLSLDSLKKNITKNTKAVIIQHSFWKACFVKEVSSLAKEKNIVTIEDCAHSLWSKINWENLGIFWDFAIFSTWRDKVISSVTWGFLLINNKKYFSKIENVKNSLKMPSIFLTIRNLNYNLYWYLAYKFYDFFKFWRIIIFLSRKLGLITEILDRSEKNCEFRDFYYKLPNSLCYLAYKELDFIDEINTHRKKLAKYYDENIKNSSIRVLKNNENEENNYFRYPIILDLEEKKDKLYNYMRKNNVLLWKAWSWVNIVPVSSSLEKAKYIYKSCPIWESISKKILFLPNHFLISLNDASKIVKLINNFK